MGLCNEMLDKAKSMKVTPFFKCREWMLLLFWIAGLGCGAKQELIVRADTCERDLATCKYAAANLIQKNRECRKRIVPPTAAPPPFIAEWESANQAIALKIRSMFRNYHFNLESSNGALIFSLPIEVLFPLGKSTLTEQGREIALRLSQIAKELQHRDMLIICRSLDSRMEGRAEAYEADREISVRRAIAVVKKLGKVGIDPMSVGAAGYPGNMDEQIDESTGRFEFVVMPLPSEMPEFPDDFLLQSPSHISGVSGFQSPVQ